MKSRKRKQELRRIIKYCLSRFCLKNSKDIRLIWDDYYYWCARQSHEILHPLKPNSYYI